MTNTQRWSIGLAALALIISIYFLGPVLTPFIVAALIAYLTDPLVDKLVKLKLPRTLAVVIVFFVVLLAVILILLALIPKLQNQIILLITQFPAIINWLEQHINPWLNQYFGISLTENMDINATVKNLIAEHWQQAGGAAKTILQLLANSSSKFILIITNLLLIPVVAFYLLRDWKSVVNGTKNLLPRSIEPTITKLTDECNQVLSAFFRGQLLVMCALAIIYSTGLWIVGINLALLIGIISGLMSIVPYLGIVVGLTSALLAALFQFHDGMHCIYVLIVYGVGQILESTTLTPLLVGDRIGLHPVAVIFAILAGGQLFGFLGILLALPVAAVIMVWLHYLKQQYLNSRLYL